MLARLILIPLSALGGWICYCWAADLVGKSAALVTLALWCFDPMILSHGALVTGDMPATVAGLAAMYSFFVWVTRPSARLSFVCGVTLGLALLTKFVWVVLPVAWMILWLPCRLASRAAARPLKRWQEVGHILLVMLVCLYVINAGFGFAGAMQSLDEYRFQSDVMQFMSGENAQENAGWAVQWLRRMPIPLPSGYLHGIDSIAHHVQPDQQITYLHGVWHRQPVWCFYIYGLLCKMPCGIWGLFAIAMGHRMWPSAARAWGLQTDLVLWLPALFVLLLASSVNSVKFLQLFLTREPIARAGYSIRIYHLDCQQANEMRAELGLEPIDCDPGRNAR